MSFNFPTRNNFITAIILANLTLIFPAIVNSQDGEPYPKWEIYGGYSFFYPHANVHGLQPGALLPVTSFLESDPRGAGAALTYNFNHWLGITGDISGHWDSNENSIVQRIDDAAFYNLSAGPKITFRSHRFAPFLEALVGENRLTPDLFHHDDRFGFLAGGGLDIKVSQHFALRLIRADYVYSNHQFGHEPPVSATEIRGARLQSGVVFLWGAHATQLPGTAACTVNPTEVIAGEPLSATAVPNNFNPKHTLNYTWTTTGGKVSGKDSTASIDTVGAMPGTFVVSAEINDPRNGRQAACSASFTVKDRPKNPPTMSCSAAPASVSAGTESSVTCSCTSPDNAEITVANWTATGGTLNASNATTAALNTSAASPGAITVSASCSDTRGLTTQASTEVMVETPPDISPEMAQLETRLALHSIYFATGRPTDQDADGGLLPSQQQTLLSLAADFKKYLQAKPGAHLTLEGHADQRASAEYNQALSERRVNRTKHFLVDHGVPEASLETRAFGKQKNLTGEEVKDAIEGNPELTPEQREKVLHNLTRVRLASNRRVDVTLSTTGQESKREYPFNAADSLTLLSEAGNRKPRVAMKHKPKAP